MTELLAVIAVIAILAAILFPVFVSARGKAYETAAIAQFQQLGKAISIYADDVDGKLPPSTNYGLPTSAPARFWPGILQPVLKSEKIFVAPGTDGEFVKKWEDRGKMSIGYSSATAIDFVQGCEPDKEDKSGCQAFTKAADPASSLSPANIVLIGLTPPGDTAKGYRGYEFSPFNGLPNPDAPRKSPPLVSDRDLVAELKDLPPDLIKPLYARYGADGRDNGSTPLIFADGHAKPYSAKAIQGSHPDLIWNFR